MPRRAARPGRTGGRAGPARPGTPGPATWSGRGRRRRAPRWAGITPRADDGTWSIW